MSERGIAIPWTCAVAASAGGAQVQTGSRDPHRSEGRETPVNRHEWNRAADTVQDECFTDDVLTVQEAVWNMAIKHAARVFRRLGAHLPWEDEHQDGRRAGRGD
jgi:hypothetical protein